MPNDGPPTLLGVFGKFLKFGLQAWGGPVAQIGMMHKALIEEERWIDETRFRRVLAVYQALPGPEATELAVYFGYERRGRVGGLLAGLGFVLPGFLLCLLLAHVYLQVGADAPGVAGLLHAVKPAVIALIANALVRLAKISFLNDLLAHIGAAAGLAALFLPVNVVLIILVLGAAYFALRRHGSNNPMMMTPLLFASLPALPGLLVFFLFFLQAGLFTFGGAYTVIPLLEEGAVETYGWITRAQFLDALALSSLLPAPLIIVGTFVGYIANGLPGAILATIGLFLPAFLFTLLAHERLVRLVENRRAHDFFDGVTAAVVGIIAASAVGLATAALVDPLTILVGLAAFALLHVYKVNVALVVLGAGLFGVALERAGWL